MVGRRRTRVLTKTHEPTERDLRIAEMRKTMTLGEIGVIEGVTRERVRQLLVKSGLYDNPDYQYRRECDECGEMVAWGEWKAHNKTHERAGIGYNHQTIEEQLKAEAIVADYQAGMRLVDMSLKYRTRTGRAMALPELYRYIHRAGVTPNRGGGGYERTPEIRNRMRAGQKRRLLGGEPEEGFDVVTRRGWRARD